MVCVGHFPVRPVSCQLRQPSFGPQGRHLVARLLPAELALDQLRGSVLRGSVLRGSVLRGGQRGHGWCVQWGLFHLILCAVLCPTLSLL